MQRPAISSSGDFRVGLLRLRERGVFRERNDGTELRFELLDPAQVDVRQALGRDLLPFDPA
jgi:hypothetical protein